MAGTLDQPVRGQPPRALPVRPAHRGERHRLPVPAYLSRLDREPRAGGRFSLGRQIGTADLHRRRASAIEDVDFYGYRAPAPADYLAASRPHDPRHAPAEPPVRQPELPVHAQQGAVPRALVRARAGGRSPTRRPRSRAGPTSPPGAGPTARASGSSPSAATSASRAATRRSTSGSSPANFGSLRGFQYRGVGPHVLGHNIGGMIEVVRLGRVPCSP